MIRCSSLVSVQYMTTFNRLLYCTCHIAVSGKENAGLENTENEGHVFHITEHGCTQLKIPWLHICAYYRLRNNCVVSNFV